MAMFNSVSGVARYALTGNKNIDALLNGQTYFRVAWSAKDAGVTQVSYSFPWADGTASKFTDNYGTGETRATMVGGVSTGQAAQIGQAFDAWSNVANIAFTKINETSAGLVGDIRVAFTSKVPNGYWGYSLGAADGASNAHGDIWIDDAIYGQSFAVGTYNFYSTMHEIGHSLGLKHPFEGTRIATGLDNRRYTIMSYSDPAGVWSQKSASGTAQYLIKTPMVYDIQAVQKIYGANLKYRTGDDIYNFLPGAPSFETIWDAGGNDTFAVANFSRGCTIDLRAGMYSSLAYDGGNIAENIGIAFNCVIENATGGAGADVIRGNEIANLIEGRAGNDTLIGNGGNDIIAGGDGNDSLLGGTGDDTINGGAGDDVLNAGADNDTVIGGDGIDTASYASATVTVKASLAITTIQATGGAGNDTLAGIENLIGGTGADVLMGSEIANTLDGGAGNDQLIGGGGQDVLIGGSGRDILIGGAGNDTFFFGALKDMGTTASAADQIYDFNRTHSDLIDISAIDAIKKTATVNDAFMFIGSAAFTKTPGQLRYVASGTVGLVSGDVDGNGVADFMIRVDGYPTLQATDFIL